MRGAVDDALLDSTLDSEIAEARRGIEQFDKRFALPALLAAGALIFVMLNYSIPKGANPLIVREYHLGLFFCLALAALAAAFGLAFCALGFIQITTPWNPKLREVRRCDGVFWYSSIARFESGATFAEHFNTLTPAALRRDKQRELWRLSWIQDGRVMALLVSRICGAFAWLGCFFAAYNRLEMGLPVGLPHWPFP